MTQFDETKHNRDAGGKFANKPHSEAAGVSLRATGNETAKRTLKPRREKGVGKAEVWLAGSRLHRDDGPAATWVGGSEAWYQEGELHREGGPAVTWADGTEEYWENGHPLPNPNPKLTPTPKQGPMSGEDITDWNTARREHVTASQLSPLVNSPQMIVRHSVADNHATAAEDLAALAKDVNPLVRERVAANPNTSPETLTSLVEDKDQLTREQAVSNPNTPIDPIMVAHRADPAKSVRSAAYKRIARLTRNQSK